VNPLPPSEATEFGLAAAKAFAALGGVDAARRAEEDPAVRSTEVAGTLGALGLEDLDPRADADALAAAAALCESAGRAALPYPVASVLLADDDGRPFAVVPDGTPKVDHGDLLPEWTVSTGNGSMASARPAAERLGTVLGPFVTDMELGGAVAGPAPVDHHLTLTACVVLGAVDRALELAVEHVNGRIQFGKPIASFQAVQFQLADCAVAVAGLRELTHFTLWRIGEDVDTARPDVLALRVHSIDVARQVLRTSQQLHGAAGVCDEYDVSVLTRMVQPALRLPWSAERTAAALDEAIRVDGFEGLFPHGGVPA
jgi:alkylation response protein AidB-like acyl-CoA dehydrogenase